MKFSVLILMMTLASNLLAKDFLPTSFHTEFTQEYTSKVSGKKVITVGAITYLYPGHLKLDVTKPDPVLYVANPKKSWYYTPPFAEGEPGELKVSDNPDNVLNRFFDVLKNGLKDNADYKVAAGKTGGQVLSFAPKAQKELGLKEAVLFFKSEGATDFSALTRLKIKDSEDQIKDFTLTKIDESKKITKDLFEFTPPENTRTSR